MRLTVLGTSGGFPAAGKATSGYLLTIGERNILIDCGSGVLANLFRFMPIERLDAVILTHLHYDHISDMQVLKYAIDLTRKSGREMAAIPVIAPASPEQIAATLQSDGNLIIGQISHGSDLKLFEATIRFVAMEHPVETYGLSIEHEGRRFVYTADSVPCANLPRLLQDADLAVMDAGTLERLRRPVMMHMTAGECARLAGESNVKKLLLSHILPLIDEQEILAEARQYFPQAALAEMLKSYEI